MQSLPKDQIASVLSDVIREALARGESIHVPGLGTFSVEHRSSQMEKQPNGQIIMKPPRDEVLFTADP